MIWIVLLIVAVCVYYEISSRVNTRQEGMTQEQRLADDISQLSPEWQKTIEIYRQKKNATNIDC